MSLIIVTSKVSAIALAMPSSRGKIPGVSGVNRSKGKKILERLKNLPRTALVLSDSDDFKRETNLIPSTRYPIDAFWAGS